MIDVTQTVEHSKCWHLARDFDLLLCLKLDDRSSPLT